MDYELIIIPTCIAIMCFAIAYILRIRNASSISTSLSDPKNQDVFERYQAKLWRRLEKRSGKIRPVTYLGIGVLSFLVITALLMMMGQRLWISLFVGLLGFYIPEMILKVYNGRMQKQFEDRYARALQQFASSLRSGMTIQQAVSDLCICPFIHESIRSGFRQIDSDLKVGISVKESFLRAAEKLESKDAMDVALAISLQNELGGNEAKVVETIARNISRRILLRREIKSLFADTNITILMMDVVPLLIVLGLLLGSPQYIAPFFESFQMTVLFIAIVAFTLLGSFVIRKVVKKGMGG